jgi:hypothetical protein
MINSPIKKPRTFRHIKISQTNYSVNYHPVYEFGSSKPVSIIRSGSATSETKIRICYGTFYRTNNDDFWYGDYGEILSNMELTKKMNQYELLEFLEMNLLSSNNIMIILEETDDNNIRDFIICNLDIVGGNNE